MEAVSCGSTPHWMPLVARPLLLEPTPRLLKDMGSEQCAERVPPHSSASDPTGLYRGLRAGSCSVQPQPGLGPFRLTQISGGPEAQVRTLPLPLPDSLPPTPPAGASYSTRPDTVSERSAGVVATWNSIAPHFGTGQALPVPSRRDRAFRTTAELQASADTLLL